jgi:hypothetical protein
VGGLGSGRDGWRATVESCLTLSAYYMQRNKILEPGSSGILSWTQGDETLASVSYKVGEYGTLLTLNYTRTRDGKQVDLQTQARIMRGPANFGGSRYYFGCPLCGRRYSKLYLPYGVDRFGCRKCYRLTYTSCNESRKCDRLFRLIAGELGTTPEQVKQALREY